MTVAVLEGLGLVFLDLVSWDCVVVASVGCGGFALKLLVADIRAFGDAETVGRLRWRGEVYEGIARVLYAA